MRNAVALEGRMIKMAEAFGGVLDGRGDPVPNADMEAAQIGRSTLGFRSDAEGKFRVPVIPNENYTLMVHPPSQWKPPDPQPGTDRALGWAPTYYPGVTIREAAGKILLPPGGRMENIELKIWAIPANSVRGTLFGPDGKPVPKVPVVMGEDLLRPWFRQETGPDGAFDFPTVIDGHWLLAAEADGPSGKLRVIEWFEVSGRDVKDLKPRLSAPFTAHGRIVIEKVEGRETPKPPSISLQPLVRWVYPNAFGTRSGSAIKSVTTGVKPSRRPSLQRFDLLAGPSPSQQVSVEQKKNNCFQPPAHDGYDLKQKDWPVYFALTPWRRLARTQKLRALPGAALRSS